MHSLTASLIKRRPDIRSPSRHPPLSRTNKRPSLYRNAGQFGAKVLSVLCQYVCLSLARVCGFMNYDLYDAILYLISCLACTCVLRINAFTIVIKTGLPTVDRHIARVSRPFHACTLPCYSVRFVPSQFQQLCP